MAPGTMQEEIRFVLRNDLRELARASELANSLLDRGGIGEPEAYATQLVLEEILSNVIRHGYEDSEGHEISVSLRASDGGVELQVEDDGREFDPLSAPEVDLGIPLEERRVGGLGIHLVRKMASEVRYRRQDGKNRVEVFIRRGGA